jgi:D-lactate dehydrogenase
MKTLIYSHKPFEKPYLQAANTKGYEVAVTTVPLTLDTSIKAKGFDAVSVFTADDVSSPVLEELHRNGVRYIAIRAAGYDNVDLAKAATLGMKVANVPAYSPYAIAEHALALVLALNRKLVTADRQVHRHDFRVDNLVGFDLHGKTVGIIGTGKIGSILVKMLHGFGCRLLGHDIIEIPELTEQYNLEYVTLDQLCRQADVISLHTGLTPATHYLINKELLAIMKKGVMLINTGRGGCVNTQDVIEYLENGHIGYYGADVYEREKGVFFLDWSGREMKDSMLQTLLQLPNVLITPHQAFATAEALTNIAATTFYNIDCWALGRLSVNELIPAAAPQRARVNIL